MLSLRTDNVVAQESGSEDAAIATIIEKAGRLAAIAARNPGLGNPDNVRVVSVPAPEATSPSGCCTPWAGFGMTGTLVAPSVVAVCTGCVPGAIGPDLGIPWPQGTAFIGAPWSTVLTFHSTVPGPCTALFAWLSGGSPIAFNTTNIADCGANNLWAVDFSNNTVPPFPGDTIAVGFITASIGQVDHDLMHFEIQ